MSINSEFSPIPSGIAVPETDGIAEWKIAAAKKDRLKAAERVSYRRKLLGATALSVGVLMSTPQGGELVDTARNGISAVVEHVENGLGAENPVTVDGLPPAGEVNPSDPALVHSDRYTPPTEGTPGQS